MGEGEDRGLPCSHAVGSPEDAGDGMRVMTERVGRGLRVWTEVGAMVASFVGAAVRG